MCLGLTLSEQSGSDGAWELGAGFWITRDFRIWLYSEQREGLKEADRRETQFTLCQGRGGQGGSRGPSEEVDGSSWVRNESGLG